MIQFEYNSTMKRTDVKVPYNLADEGQEMVMVATISENNKINLHKEISLNLMKQILLHWDEKEHMDIKRAEREAGEFDKYFDYNPENNNLTKSIDEFEFSTRVYWILRTAGIRTIGQLVEKKESEILKIKNCGRKSLTELQEKLIELDLQFKQ